jgi:hypothetical protein
MFQQEGFSQQVGFKFKEETSKVLIWKIALCGGETWTLREVDQKYLKNFELWCWRRMEKINWTDHVRNEMLQRVKEERNILHTIKKRKADWIGHMSRTNWLLKLVTEGKIEERHK